MDDFGTGYSSLSQLHRIPLDALKIDRGFVATMEEDKTNRAIVGAITTIAHSMNLTVVGEGVESGAQRELLRKMGCNLLQGYLFGQPMDAQAATRYLEDPNTIQDPSDNVGADKAS